MEGLAKALRGGADRAVAYVAWGDDRWLPGWAEIVGAVDLSTGQPADPPGDELRKLLDDLDFAGNNGWYDAPGKRDARNLLAELDQKVTRDYTAGALLAMGHSVKSVTDLRQLRAEAKIIGGGFDTSRRW